MKRRKDDGTLRTSVMMPKHVLEFIKAEARKTHRSVSGMIAEITLDYMKKARA